MRKRVSSILLGILILGISISHPSLAYEKVSLGEVEISAYCAETNDPPNSTITCTGHEATPYHTIAVDMFDPIVPYGAKVMIEGDDTVYTVEDCGNLHHYGREFDVFMESYQAMDDWGVRKKEVFLLKKEKKKETKPQSPSSVLLSENKGMVLVSVDMGFIKNHFEGLLWLSKQKGEKK